jgi:hypothetical protein
VLVLLDGTWSLALKMFRESPCLHDLPRAMFGAPPLSRFVIKQQPRPDCLSTLEAVHEALIALERAGLDRYPLPGQLPDLLVRMQAIQIRCAADPARAGYRRRPYRRPEERSTPSSAMRRATPAPAPEVSPSSSTRRTLPSLPT